LPPFTPSAHRHVFAVAGEPTFLQAPVQSTEFKSLDGLGVLLVEDQTLIALDTEAMLLELGAAKVKTFGAADEALAWLTSAAPDVGVLDINLGVASSFPIAEALRRRGIPFIFTTGYGDGVLIPAPFDDVQILQKPYTIEALGQFLGQCLHSDRP
jgi:DNA-binding NtrC family response regulator